MNHIYETYIQNKEILLIIQQKRTNNPIKKVGKGFKLAFLQRSIQMSKKRKDAQHRYSLGKHKSKPQ